MKKLLEEHTAGFTCTISGAGGACSRTGLKGMKGPNSSSGSSWSVSFTSSIFLSFVGLGDGDLEGEGERFLSTVSKVVLAQTYLFSGYNGSNPSATFCRSCLPSLGTRTRGTSFSFFCYWFVVVKVASDVSCLRIDPFFTLKIKFLLFKLYLHLQKEHWTLASP